MVSSSKKKLSRKERKERQQEQKRKDERVPLGKPLPPLTDEEAEALGQPPTEEELARMIAKWEESAPDHARGYIHATIEEPLDERIIV